MKKLKLMLLMGCIVLLGVSLLACNGSNEEELDSVINEENERESDSTQGQENDEKSDSTHGQENDEELDSILEQEDETESEILELGDDLYSFKIKVDGVVYSLPVPFSELMENGWMAEGLEGEELLPGQWSSVFEVRNDEGHSLGVRFINNTLDVITLEESEVMAIEHFNLFGLREIDIVLPGGITMDSSLEEIIEKHGEPTEQRERTWHIFLRYGSPACSFVEFQFDIETEELLGVYMTNQRRREESPEFQGEIPDIIHDYVAPYQLGEDWQTFNVRIEGDLFQLPAPVMAFIDKGWEIVEDPNEIVAAQNWGPRIYLRRENQMMPILTHNYANTAQPVLHTFVVGVSQFQISDADGPPFQMELPGGVTNESTIDEVIAIFGEPTERLERVRNVRYIFGDGRELAEINIVVSNDDQRITSITVQNRPRTLEFE